MSVDSKAFYDFFTEGNWVDSKGNKVKSWKQKILTWNEYSKDKRQEKRTNFKGREYTQEEFKTLYANNSFEGE